MQSRRQFLYRVLPLTGSLLLGRRAITYAQPVAEGRRWGCINSGLIAFIKGAFPAAATGMPVLAHYTRINLTFKMGPGGTPCIRPSPFDREHWTSLVDDYSLRIEEYEEDDVVERIQDLRDEYPSLDLLVLVGHSAGADAALRIANSRRIKPVTDLLVLIDPYAIVSVSQVDAGAVRHAMNFYTNRGPAGVHGYPIQGAQNRFLGDDFRCPMQGCSQGHRHEYTHTNIDDCDYIKKQVFGAIQALFPD